MESSKNSLAFLSFMVLTTAHLCLAQNIHQDFVAAHNSERALLGLKSFTWNRTVAKYARHYAKIRSQDCRLEHSHAPNYGENIAIGGGDFTGVAAVKLWESEKPHYDYASNACVGGPCLHYTQVVWKNTTQIGCARVKCNNEWWFITCNYYPPGNYIGQRPY